MDWLEDDKITGLLFPRVRFMKYRPDIDGLRAIAILLVLVYHGGLAYFPSGFVGVDVFFVISGFLITSIINGSLNNQNFSFIEFYNRRLWRLQPVFVCLIVCTTILSLLFFLPEDLIQFSRSARKTSLFISNLFFNHTTTGYFSPDTHQLPLLHTWSLSIEWQCYLILPIAMYCLHRMLSNRNVIRAVFLLTILCFLITLRSSHNIPAQTYYLFSSRMFEFLLGSCIALIPLHRVTLDSRIVSIVGILSLSTIFYSASLNHILLGYPNWYAFSVCLATGILIALGKYNSEHFLVKALSVKPLVFIGVLSYSLYIWHWVVFSFLRYQGNAETPLILFLAYLFIFVLGYLSWRYIEKPARRYHQLPFQYTVIILLLMPIAFTHLNSALIRNHSGFPQRFDQELVHIYKQLEEYNSAQRPLCISNKWTDYNSVCKLGAKKVDSKSGLMIGDSFSNHYWGLMDTFGKDAGITIQAEGTSSCITLPGIFLYDWWTFKNSVYQECFDNTQKYYRMIRNNHYDYVIIGQVWSNYLTDSIINQIGDKRSVSLSKQRFKVALDTALKVITDTGAKPVLIKSTALMQNNALSCFYRHIKLHQSYNPELCNFNLYSSRKDLWINVVFDEMKLKYPQLIVIDPKTVQCPNNRCKADINGVPIYRDAGHITDYASYQFGKLYLQELGNPLT